LFLFFNFFNLVLLEWKNGDLVQEKREGEKGRRIFKQKDDGL